jgi:hypothetical protein
MRKQISRRTWKKRWLKGLWLPSVVIKERALPVPAGYVAEPHPSEPFFWRLVKESPNEQSN